jgi:hypothetical protein
MTADGHGLGAGRNLSGQTDRQGAMYAQCFPNDPLQAETISPLISIALEKQIDIRQVQRVGEIRAENILCDVFHHGKRGNGHPCWDSFV